MTERWPDVAVLFMSGYTDGMLADQGVDFDAIRLLRKPFATDELLRAVAGALARRRPPLTALPPSRKKKVNPMSPLPYEEPAWASTPIGEISLRTRYHRLTRRDGRGPARGRVPMSSQFNATEIALARLGMAAAPRRPATSSGSSSPASGSASPRTRR